MTYGIVPVEDFEVMRLYVEGEAGITLEASDEFDGYYLASINEEQFSKMPDIEIGISSGSSEHTGRSFKLTKEDYLVEADEDDKYVFAFQPFNDTQLESVEGHRGFWILGLMFLKKHYTIFDVANQRIGLVPADPSAAKINWRYTLRYFGIGLGLFTLLTGFCFCCCCFCFRPCRKKSDTVEAPLMVVEHPVKIATV